MEIYYNLKKSEVSTAVALGFFDGVHIAHRKILERAAKYSRRGLKPCVLTFSQNPRAIVENIKPDLITTNEQKLDIMKNIGIQAVYMPDFNSIRDLSPENFVNKILHDTLNAKAVFCGFNYRFGKSGAGDTDTLKKLCKEYNIEVFVQAPVLYKDKPVSSTRIRSAIKNQDFESVNNMLIKK
ncbi:MAG: hypothetical protein IKE05_02600 [Clostridia bacterium]|nr:hypothetical protein [Clostridia bacterium]